MPLPRASVPPDPHIVDADVDDIDPLRLYVHNVNVVIVQPPSHPADDPDNVNVPADQLIGDRRSTSDDTEGCLSESNKR